MFRLTAMAPTPQYALFGKRWNILKINAKACELRPSRRRDAPVVSEADVGVRSYVRSAPVTTGAVVMMIMVRMVMVVTMVMMIVVGMIAAGTVVVVVVVMVVMMVRVVARLRHLVGATLGIERRLDAGDTRAERGELRFEGGIVAQAQPVGEDLHRHVTVAKPPGEPRKCREVSRTQLDQRLGLDDDLDEPAIVETERIAHAQPHRLRQLEPQVLALEGGQFAVLNLTRVGAEQHRVDQLRVAARSARDHLRDAIHEPCPSAPVSSGHFKFRFRFKSLICTREPGGTIGVQQIPNRRRRLRGNAKTEIPE